MLLYKIRLMHANMPANIVLNVSLPPSTRLLGTLVVLVSAAMGTSSMIRPRHTVMYLLRPGQGAFGPRHTVLYLQRLRQGAFGPRHTILHLQRSRQGAFGPRYRVIA